MSLLLGYTHACVNNSLFTKKFPWTEIKLNLIGLVNHVAVYIFAQLAKTTVIFLKGGSEKLKVMAIKLFCICVARYGLIYIPLPIIFN